MNRTAILLSLTAALLVGGTARAQDEASPELKALSWCYSLKVAQMNHLDDSPRKVAKLVLDACRTEFDQAVDASGRSDDRDDIEDEHLDIVTQQVVKHRNSPSPLLGGQR